MIELKTYHTPKSTEIQAIWQGDQYLITKVASIAYKILVENVGLFLYNQTAKVRNFFNKDKEPTPATETPVPNYASVFSNMVHGAVVSTLIHRGIWSLFGWAPSLFEKVPQCAEKAYFSRIHRMKLLELKYFALASAAVPFTINLIDAVRKEPKNLPLSKRVFSAAKKQFSAPHFILYASMIGLSLSSSLYGRALSLTSDDGFDASVNLMRKVVLAPIVGAALSQTARNHPTFATIFTMAYSFTDGVFIRHTTKSCHTLFESLVGYAWGAGIKFTSFALARTYLQLNPPKAAKTA